MFWRPGNRIRRGRLVLVFVIAPSAVALTCLGGTSGPASAGTGCSPLVLPLSPGSHSEYVIRPRGVSCTSARTVVRELDRRLRDAPSRFYGQGHFGAPLRLSGGWICRWNRLGNDVGKGRCTGRHSATIAIRFQKLRPGDPIPRVLPGFARHSSVYLIAAPAVAPSRAEQRPRAVEFLMTGGDWFTALHWTTWGGSTATATGTLHAMVCKPDCASGHATPRPGKLVLSRICTSRGRRYYAHAEYTYQDRNGRLTHGRNLGQPPCGPR